MAGLAAPLAGLPRAYAASQPLTDRSCYVQDANTGTVSQLGCSQGNYDAGHGDANSSVTLDFGGQTTVSGGQGTQPAFAPYPLTNDQVILDAYNFAVGYFNCTGADTSSLLYLFVGTNNSLDLSYATGEDWAGVVNAVRDKVDGGGYASQVAVLGADDIEDEFAGPSPTLDWVSGYSAVAQVGYADYGDAGSCPPDRGCLNGWTPQEVYQVASGASYADFPTPEIYSSGTDFTPTQSPATKPTNPQAEVPPSPSDCAMNGPVGIASRGAVPGFYQVDYWTGYVGQIYYAVDAGATTPSSTGELEVWNHGTAQGCYVSHQHVRWVTDSSIPGPFDIVAADGVRLTIRGANGAMFTYVVGAASQQPGLVTSESG